jgi:hypothetical protein
MEEKDSSELIKRFKDLLSLHERTLKYLESNKSDSVLIRDYKCLQSYLRNLSDDESYTILTPKAKKLISNRTQPINELEDHQIKDLTTEQVEQEISKDKISRKYLERIAIVRFGASKGGITSLRNREAVIEKLHTLISNEQTHETIARVASGYGMTGDGD